MRGRPDWLQSLDRTPVAMGAMRLSTDAARDDERSMATLHAAFDAGVDVVDTADAYAWDASDAGHNERLIARALSSWSGDRSRVTVITKGGLTRPQGRWVPDGRARHLAAACRSSLDALGVTSLALYQLHAPDSRVPWMTSVRALAALVQSGRARAVGLCNVTVAQIEAARAVVDVATVQVELSPWNDRQVASGVVEYCHEHAIRLIAYRPFGGVRGNSRVASDSLLARIAAAHQASPFEIVLAWMRSLAPHIIPLPGPTRPETARSCGRAHAIAFTEAEQAALDGHLPLGRMRRQPRRPPRPARSAAGEDIVMVMGLPGAGKSTFAAELVNQGYERLNRDEMGGTLSGLVTVLGERIEAGVSRIVLDNTYLTRASRTAVIDAAAERGRAVRGIWLETSLEDAQVNVVWRMVRANGRLLSPEEMRAGRQAEAITPSALFRSQRGLEPLHASERFASVDVVPFSRTRDAARTGRALIMWCDGVIGTRAPRAPGSLPAGDLLPLVQHRERLARYHDAGWRLLAISWEPEVAVGNPSAEAIEARFARLRDALGLDIEFHYCPHGAGPPVCWCRKPLPGLGVLLIHRHGLDPSQCIYVGSTPQDPPFARRFGFEYRIARDFFG